MFRIQLILPVFLLMVKEICEVFSTATAFEELEERIQYLVQNISGKLIKIVLEEIDLKLSKDRDKKRYKNLDKWERTLITTDRKSLNKILPKTVINPNEKINKKDWSEWLTATIPAIDGPHADRFWVKHVLRELTKLQNKSA